MSHRIGLDGRGLGNINRNRGIGRYTAHLIKALCSVAPDNEYLVFGYGDQPEAGPVGGLPVSWRTVPGGDGPPYGKLREHLSFARAINREKLDLFHGIDHNMTPFLKCPNILTVHDLIPLVLRGPYLGPKSMLWMRAHMAAARRADRVIAVSECTARDVARIWGIPPERITVVGEGVTSEFSPPEEGDNADLLARYGITKPYFLYIGGFDPRKNIGNMLTGFRRYIAEGCAETFVLCGDTSGFEEYLSDELEELWLGERVLLPGFIDDADLPALYNGARALIFLSIYEGFGLPLLEAMACGAPVLASNAASIPEVTGGAAVLVDPLNPDEIAGGFAKLAHDSDWRDGLIRRGMERAASFSWEGAARRISTVYGELLGGGAS